jgi:hypothetical protein
MSRLPLDKHGRPVPWFAAWIDGVPDFRVADGQKFAEAVRFKLCWVCGQPVGRFVSFVIGPMCAVNRITAEPGCHRECAVFSARGCPFLARPTMRRRESGLPEDYTEAGGKTIRRNPGVALVYVTRDWKPFRVPPGMGEEGILFELGDPTETLWYAEGREATRAEVMASIESGLPLLRQEAERDPDNPAGAVAELDRQYAVAMRLIPVEVPGG